MAAQQQLTVMQIVHLMMMSACMRHLVLAREWGLRGMQGLLLLQQQQRIRQQRVRCQAGCRMHSSSECRTLAHRFRLQRSASSARHHLVLLECSVEELHTALATLLLLLLCQDKHQQQVKQPAASAAAAPQQQALQQEAHLRLRCQ
jgi:hypothetical protein